MGKVTEILLKDFNDPIFDSSYEIYSPKRKVLDKEFSRKYGFDYDKKDLWRNRKFYPKITNNLLIII